ncbi:hypothetical protein NPIL_95681 [Nephila pilipes]|uniref:Uncharacterized protein n=1 Tax=Nephila pilipes TaxID=299642 RepID=A0A8X6Q2I5_NEPPI|nr:hypothetical protein NPIL_95681 [Nephila pilipes]
MDSMYPVQLAVAELEEKVSSGGFKPSFSEALILIPTLWGGGGGYLRNKDYEWWIRSYERQDDSRIG